MPYKNKIYVAFDGDTDIHYYYLMKAWTNNDNFDFEINDAHDLNTARDSSQEESIKNQLRLRLQNSKALILLIGENTKYLRKFVRWELEYALKNNIPIIAVNLNGKRERDIDRCPAIIRDELVVHVSFAHKIIKHALDNWLDEYKTLKSTGQSSARYYNAEVYKRLGI
ncbi:MAG: TIR domain-containing protein [Bacteroidia bacterium]|jgi:hypothetical protein